ncbi:MAG: hypothetical protein O3A01_05915 [bacterium]|nr:hypothetical protein [bacterium]
MRLTERLCLFNLKNSIVLLCVAMFTLMGCTAPGGGGTSAILDSSDDTADIDMFEIGGLVTGLTGGDSFTIRLNSGDPVVIDENGAFVFVTEIEDDSEYTVSMVEQAVGKTCTIGNGAGVIAGADITNVNIVCAAIRTR